MNTLLRGAVTVMSGTAVAFGVTAGFEAPASAASSCHTSFSSYHAVRNGSHGSQAKGAQCLLHSAGYSVRADGSFSSADAKKAKRFQSRHHLRASGVVDSRSWSALLSRGSRPTLHYGSRGPAVVRLQKALTASGRHVPATGWFGPITRNAVKSLQRARHFPVTGRATASVWHALQFGGATKAAPVRHVAKKSHKVVARSTSGSSSRGARALSFARRQLGERYVWGAAGPNRWDCSGLTRGAWKSAGVSLPHNARMQFSRGRHISKSQLRPGDLVFFYGGIKHVAIYAGGGRIIHAPRPGKRVSYSKVSYMPYKGARRPG